MKTQEFAVASVHPKGYDRFVQIKLIGLGIRDGDDTATGIGNRLQGS